MAFKWKIVSCAYIADVARVRDHFVLMKLLKCAHAHDECMFVCKPPHLVAVSNRIFTLARHIKRIAFRFITSVPFRIDGDLIMTAATYNVCFIFSSQLY